MTAFYDGYADAQVTPPPDELVEFVLVPAVLHTPWAVFREYPPAVQQMTVRLLMAHIAAGHGLNVDVVRITQDA